MSRIDDLKKQNPNLNINLIDLIAEADPSDSYKYLGFLIKMLKENSSNNNVNILRHMFGEENLLALKKFDDHSRANRIKVKDISLYNSFKQIKEEVSEADELVRIKEMEKQTKILYKNDEWFVIIPLSYEASRLYGKGTKWCTTQEKYWNQYIPDYKIIYIIDKKNNNNYAISCKVSNNLVEGWMSNDDPINPFIIPIPFEILAKITEEIRKGESITDMHEYKTINKRSSYIDGYEHYGSIPSPTHNHPSLIYDVSDYEFDLESFQNIINASTPSGDLSDTYIDMNHISQFFKKYL